ncbi:MAG: flippase-like domain-containing protein [Candidatus Bathyarchaeota archaeon]|nr:flippase-like domain-containing protein [Candidatus Bathyarchaeota archaeon]
MNSRKIIRILLQVVFMIAIFAALLLYVGIGSLYEALLNVKVEYLILAFASYFGINLLFTLRLQRVLGKEGVKTSFGKTLMAQYAGMLTSDVTPGRSGYILTPLYLRDQNVPSSKSLSGILSIQTIEFLVKVVGGVGAVIFLLQVVPFSRWQQEFPTFLGVNSGLFVAGLGITLMLIGAIILAAFTWSKRAISLFNRIANWRFLKRFTGGLIGKLEEFKESSQKNRKAIPEILGLTMACWILKGFEWYFLSLALGIVFPGLSPVLTWLAFFLIHPLATALGFVPITPAGMGVQEFGILGIFALLFAWPVSEPITASLAAFALLARGLLVIEDLIGIPQIVKSTSSLSFSRKKPQEDSTPDTATAI